MKPLVFHVLCILLSIGQPANADSSARPLLELHNQTRVNGYRCQLLKQKRAAPLYWNTQLEAAALQHAKFMANRKRLSHKINGNARKRLKRVGYRWSALGENIASGFSDAKSTHNAWLNSANHCNNLMNKSFTEMGAARYQNYWVVILARPKE